MFVNIAIVMRPSIFIHLKNDTKFLKYCVNNFKDKCTIIVNCYGNKQDVIDYCRANSDHFYQTAVGGKNDIVKSLPFIFNDGVWVCNDDVEIEGDVWGMFCFANSDKQNIDLVYPPTDNLYLDNTKLGVHNRHRLSSSAYFLTEAGIKKLRLGHPLAYTYTYYGANIKHVQKLKTITPAENIESGFSTEVEYSPIREELNKQLLKVVNKEFYPVKTKNVIVTLTTEGREFIDKTKDKIKEIADHWGADFKIYRGLDSVFTYEQKNKLLDVQSKRANVINYYAKMQVIYNALKEYDRVLWIDDTCIVSPFTQNLFSAVPEDHLGALVIKRNSGMSEPNHDFEYIKKQRGIDIDDSYINSGVLLASKCHKNIFSFEEMLNHKDLFESFYPTQCYIAYKITTDKIPVFNITSVNHLMPAMLKYEDKLFTQAESLLHETRIIAAHNIVHFSGFNRYREKLHEEMFRKFNEIFDQKITLVVMNYSRPDNIKNKLIPFYSLIPAVNQIVISHCKASAKFDYDSTAYCEITHRDDVLNNDMFGLFTRYIAAAESSKNDCVVVIDDDMLVPGHILSQLYYLWKKSPLGLYGTRGRAIDKTKKGWEYNDKVYVNNADVLLTHCAMTSREIYAKLIPQEKYFHATAMKAIVPWNGEDILLSTFVKFLNQNRHPVIHGEYIELSDQGAVSATSDHKQVRDKLVTEIYNHYTDIIRKALI